jgi:hypothetical protein
VSQLILRGLNAHCRCLLSYVASLLTVSVWCPRSSTLVPPCRGLEALVNLRTVDTTHRNLHNTVLSNSLFEKLFLFGNQFNNEALLEVSLRNGEKLGDNGKSIQQSNNTFLLPLPCNKIPRTHRLIRLMRLLNLIEGIERERVRESFALPI